MSPVALREKSPLRATYRLPVRRLFWLPIGISGTLVVAVLLALVWVALVGLRRVEPIQAHLGDIGRLRDLGMAMEQVLFRGMQGTDPIATTELASLRDDLAGVIPRTGYLSPETPERLRGIEALLSDAGSKRMDNLSRALGELRTTLAGERQRLDLLIDKVARDTRAEFDLALVLLGVLPLLGIGGVLMLRRRVQRPLASLGDLLARLAERDYRPVPETLLNDSSALVQPAFAVTTSWSIDCRSWRRSTATGSTRWSKRCAAPLEFS